MTKLLAWMIVALLGVSGVALLARANPRTTAVPHATVAWKFPGRVASAQDSSKRAGAGNAKSTTAAPAAPASEPLKPFPWAVTLHANPDHDGNGRAYEPADFDLAKGDLALARDLGFKLIRMDFRWREIEPENGRTDDRAVAFYRWFVDEAKARRLKVIGVLQTYEPEWAGNLRIGDWDRWLGAVERFTALCAREFGHGVSYWQMLNETNRVARMAGDLIGPNRALEAFRVMSRAVRENDRVGMRKTVVNLFTDLDGAGWQATLELYATFGADAIDVFAIDHYPGTWSPVPGRVWTDLEWLMARVGRLKGKSVAIIETGFATYAPLIADEAAQKRFVEEAIPAIRRVVSRPPVGAERVRMEFGGWYHLYDEIQKESDMSFIPQEGKFGILHADRSEKAAAPALRRQLLRR